MMKRCRLVSWHEEKKRGKKDNISSFILLILRLVSWHETEKRKTKKKNYNVSLFTRVLFWHEEKRKKRKENNVSAYALLIIHSSRIMTWKKEKKSRHFLIIHPSRIMTWKKRKNKEKKKIITSHHSYEWVMTHKWMSHVTRMKESYHPHEWVMTHVRMSHDTRTNESWHTYEWWDVPLTEEIRLQIFGSQDLSDFPIDLLSDGDSVYSRENSFEISRTPVKMCLICTGTPVKKTCWTSCQL